MARLEGGGGLKFPEKPCRRTKPHTLLPRAIFEPEDEWLPISAGRWAYADHITLGECRAVLKTLDPILAVSKAHRQKIICLEDNQPTKGAFTKGRSSAPAVNYLARRKAARTLTGDVRLLLPWVESAKMPADWLSRLLHFRP